MGRPLGRKDGHIHIQRESRVTNTCTCTCACVRTHPELHGVQDGGRHNHHQHQLHLCLFVGVCGVWLCVCMLVRSAHVGPLGGHGGGELGEVGCAHQRKEGRSHRPPHDTPRSSTATIPDPLPTSRSHLCMSMCICAYIIYPTPCIFIYMHTSILYTKSTTKYLTLRWCRKTLKSARAMLLSGAQAARISSAITSCACVCV